MRMILYAAQPLPGADATIGKFSELPQAVADRGLAGRRGGVLPGCPTAYYTDAVTLFHGARAFLKGRSAERVGRTSPDGAPFLAVRCWCCVGRFGSGLRDLRPFERHDQLVEG